MQNESINNIPSINQTHKWLVTGVAGFIGSNILEELLLQNQIVIGVDNFSTGFRSNLDAVRNIVGPDKWKLFTFHENDICDADKMLFLTKGCDFVLHQAALGSVPRSIKNPIATNNANVVGFLSVIDAARQNHVKKFVFASSSSVYGSSPDLPKFEEKIGEPLSPYAGTKLVDEIYAEVFRKTYCLPYIGLRYFNVFGKRQSPEGEYAAVVPKWIDAAIKGDPITINGDGETSRDFCYIKNAVQANIRAALASESGTNKIYNVACGRQNTLNVLLETICNSLKKAGIDSTKLNVSRAEIRKGDIRHSLGEISRAKSLLGYIPSHDLAAGINELVRDTLGLSH